MRDKNELAVIYETGKRVQVVPLTVTISKHSREPLCSTVKIVFYVKKKITMKVGRLKRSLLPRILNTLTLLSAFQPCDEWT